MKKDFAKELKQKAEEVAQNFSRPDRRFNISGETFVISKIVPLSETTAGVYYEKNTGKKATAFFYYLRSGGWKYFFPTDSHILGMESFGKHKLIVEELNYEENFKEEENYEKDEEWVT